MRKEVETLNVSIVARNTRRIIQERGLKQNRVAERANIPPKLFSSLLCGRKIIRDTDVIAIANALGVTPNELFRREEPS